jgi:iron(III) transport system permease protein
MTNKPLFLWQLTGLLGLVAVPWYAIEDGFWNFEWLFDGYPFDSDYAPLLFLFLQGEAPWLWPTAAFLAASAYALRCDKIDPAYAITLLLAGGGGFAYVLLQGFTVGIDGWEYQVLNDLFGPMERQYGMGYGALLIMGGLFFLFTQGLAARGAVNGDVFVVGSIGLIVAVVAIFIFFPVSRILISAVQDNEGVYSLTEFTGKLFSAKIWGLHCLEDSRGCGVAWNSFVLAVAVGIGSTLLGLAFALIATRTGFRYKRALRALTVLPIITPPFVIGLAPSARCAP